MRLPRIILPLLVTALGFAGHANAADWKGSFDASYQAAQPGDTITVPAGTLIGDQVIQPRRDLQNLPVPCAPGQPAACVHFVTSGPTTVNGVLEIRGSSVWVEGSNRLRFNGYVDTEADSNALHPDHVIVEGTSSPSFGVFNAERVWFKNMDVGPATVTGASCGIREGRGMENKIGWGGGITYVPKDVVLDGLRVHDQNGDIGRELGDCHWGGLFLVTVDGLTIRNSVFEANVVYHVQVQNFGGSPPAKRVVFDHNSFSCPAEWKYVAVRCDGQRAIQFDYDPAGQFTLTNNVAANGANGLYGCYVGTCGGLASLIVSGNVNLAESLSAPPLLGGTAPPPPVCSDGLDNDNPPDGKADYPADPGCSSASDTDETDPAPPPPVCAASGGTSVLTLTKLSETATTITLGWAPVVGAIGYRFVTSAAGSKYSTTNDPLRSSVKFGKIAAGGCYYVLAQMPGAGGGYFAATRTAQPY